MKLAAAAQGTPRGAGRGFRRSVGSSCLWPWIRPGSALGGSERPGGGSTASAGFPTTMRACPGAQFGGTVQTARTGRDSPAAVIGMFSHPDYDDHEKFLFAYDA